jgi:cytidyltransferase-like protein
VIVSFEELRGLRGQVGMVDGAFDPLHHGHIEYFRVAKAQLGIALLCNLAPDEYVSRKHPPLLAQEHRAIVIDAIRYIDYTHKSARDTETVLRELAPRYYVKGADWKGRLPTEQEHICREHGIEVVYLDTVRDSSTRLLQQFGLLRPNQR